MKFKVGDKVIVKARPERPLRWNRDGKMDDYMGKICTITRFYDDDNYELNYDFWIFRQSDLMPVPRPGDGVKIRSWEDMEQQYGKIEDCIINRPSGESLIPYMKKYCGKVIYPNALGLDRSGKFISFDYDGCCFYPWMYEEVYRKEDDKMQSTFTKSDLRDGMIVEYRNGKMRLVVDDQLLGVDMGECADLCNYYDDLNNIFSSDLTVDRVYVKNKIVDNIRSLFCINHLKLIWEREAVKEISTSEVMKILREKFGCDVKIVENK